jgi:carboxyl-terminal processing protease
MEGWLRVEELGFRWKLLLTRATTCRLTRVMVHPRKSLLFQSLLASMVLLGNSAATLAQSPTAVSPKQADPIAYLNRALDEMQTRALRRAAVDWPRVRAEALTRAAQAKTTVDTYDAIRFALASLGDHHSSLHLTAELEKLESQRKTQSPSLSEPAPQQPPPSPFVGRYEPEGRLATFGGRTFALVVVTKCFPENERQFVVYETKLQRILGELDRSHPAGWIVDLRGNVGGNVWPMLAGIGPLLGEGDDLHESFTVDGHSFSRYRDGVAAEVGDGKEFAYPGVEGTPYKMAGTPSVAVLIDHRTGSSGEAIAIAFRGRSNTRFFGEHSAGVSTVNETFALPDGASLWLTIGVQADRTGKQYPDGLGPDEEIRVANTILPDDQDPALQAALKWLSRAQPQ